MPNDRNGQPLSVGDKVMVPCTVIATFPVGFDDCNCTVQIDEPAHPDRLRKSMPINGRQVEKVNNLAPLPVEVVE